MTSDVIQSLLQVLPDGILQNSTLGCRESAAPDWGPDPEVSRFTTLYSRQDFGWSCTKLMVDHHIPFPGGLLHGDDELLFRAYMFMTHPRAYPSKDVQQALAIRTNQLRNVRHTVEGLLLHRDATIPGVAALSNMPVGAIQAYERLFFNVLDRKDDVMYLQQLVYPHGRVVELLAGYYERESLGAIARRAGYNNGPTDVMYFMGASNSSLEALQRVSVPDMYEKLVMAFGYLIARNGGLSQANNAGINNAKALLTAGKLGGSDTGSRPMDDDLAKTIQAEISQYAKPVMQRAGIVDV